MAVKLENGTAPRSVAIPPIDASLPGVAERSTKRYILHSTIFLHPEPLRASMGTSTGDTRRYVFDGKKYQVESSVELEGEEQDGVVERLKKAPRSMDIAK